MKNPRRVVSPLGCENGPVLYKLEDMGFGSCHILGSGSMTAAGRLSRNPKDPRIPATDCD
ncbi:hypothetical protein BCAR13_80115 [Paraburkholderia caribensis]|nr:hypothetical protein BCAR13_80115 [Paraburkholderia caribensis]